MLQRGEAVPHFDVQDLGGRRVAYETLWQRQALVLISVGDPDAAASRRYADSINAAASEFSSVDAACVVTADRVPGLGAPGVLVADRWGEVVYAAAAPDVAALPGVAELLDWARWVQMRCPECEGESR